jgi:hypothetical protein
MFLNSMMKLAFIWYISLNICHLNFYNIYRQALTDAGTVLTRLPVKSFKPENRCCILYVSGCFILNARQKEEMAKG